MKRIGDIWPCHAYFAKELLVHDRQWLHIMQRRAIYRALRSSNVDDDDVWFLEQRSEHYCAAFELKRKLHDTYQGGLLFKQK